MGAGCSHSCCSLDWAGCSCCCCCLDEGKMLAQLLLLGLVQGAGCAQLLLLRWGRPAQGCHFLIRRLDCWYCCCSSDRTGCSCGCCSSDGEAGRSHSCCSLDRGRPHEAAALSLRQAAHGLMLLEQERAAHVSAAHVV
uniref:Uncharacterized protein n=1 Tax=Myotis myotis TaxID=51298 RepID=A0A7J7Z5M6_MYOMY|nr:hypothetical protein mMyoMyo1_010683 [Myotis myotis]